MLFWKRVKTTDVVCPHCGAHQTESEECISTVCKRCGEYFQVDQAVKLKKKKRLGRGKPVQRDINCFKCQSRLTVSSDAISTICPYCSYHVDLNDYTINTPYGKGLETKGNLYLGEKGAISAERVVVGHAELKGRLRLKQLVCEGSVELYPTGNFYGNVKAGRIIVMQKAFLESAEQTECDSAEIYGKLKGRLICHGKVMIHKAGFVEGEITARAVDIEPGGALSGFLRIQAPPPPAVVETAPTPSPAAAEAHETN